MTSEKEANGNGAGSVLVAVRPAEVQAMEARLIALDAQRCEHRAQTPERVIIEAAFTDASVAAAVSRDLRSTGALAVIGPPGPAHWVGWQNRTAPIWFGDGACVCFPWSEFDRAEADLVIEIDPGSGFGAGAHPTTTLLLRELHQRIAGGESVLDVGCGTGVLAIAALRLGADRAVGVDIAEEAVVASGVNIGLNGLVGRFDASQRPVEEVDGSFDVIVANIHAPVLASMVPALQRLLRPGGWLGLSGLSPAQTSTLIARLAPLVITDTRQADDWVALIATQA